MQIRMRVGPHKFQIDTSILPVSAMLTDLQPVFEKWKELVREYESYTVARSRRHVRRAGNPVEQELPAKDWSDPKNTPPFSDFEPHQFKKHELLEMCAVCGGGESHDIHSAEAIARHNETAAKLKVVTDRAADPRHFPPTANGQAKSYHLFSPHDKLPLCTVCGGGELHMIHCAQSGVVAAQDPPAAAD